MPTTYDQVTGVPSYEIPGAEADGNAPIGDGIENPRTAEQDERLNAILDRIEAKVIEVQGQISDLKERTIVVLNDLKASIDASFERLTKTD